MFVAIEDRVALPASYGDGDDLVGEDIRLLRGACLLLGVKCEAILIFAGDLVPARERLDRVAHVDVVERIPQTVEDHHILDGGVAHFLA